ncbi:hypothetical protein K458DRAFT_395129 [Lentithecium fluviatile CBS 122367]|uniref:DUF7703 domain-containing protein n=1 Tax=Lentithecium fluviatile CBS 122367 TaxID=1168545 RepID=A0A6G1IJ99_9PLEO|nr:hypothetical protein K458DRAFT_395129 [Lentithecium fluviatile CBS 122367]
MATSQLQIGPLRSTVEVVAFVAHTGMAWFNSVELLITTFLSFKRWTGRYFYCLLVASAGVLVYQVFVFAQTFASHLNAYVVTACIDVGWSAMVTGQSLVLWSRLHLVCRSRWKLRAILCMIIVNGVCLHIPQTGFSLAAIKNNQLNPLYKPFEVTEKVAISLFTAQELIISSVYLWESMRILRVGELVQKKTNRRRIQKLFLANIVIIFMDVATLTLEFKALWGVWCSFKGFGYSVKLKVEFAILNQLRDSVKSTNGSSNGAYGYGHSGDNDISLGSRTQGKSQKSGMPPNVPKLELNWHMGGEIEDPETIRKTTEIEVRHDDRGKVDAQTTKKKSAFLDPPSETSSEIEFAARGGYTRDTTRGNTRFDGGRSFV